MEPPYWASWFPKFFRRSEYPWQKHVLPVLHHQFDDGNQCLMLKSLIAKGGTDYARRGGADGSHSEGIEGILDCQWSSRLGPASMSTGLPVTREAGRAAG